MLIFTLQYGNEIRQYLPRADNSGSRKKTLWKTLFEGFDQIDGKPSHTDKEVHTHSHTHTHTHTHTHSQSGYMYICIIKQQICFPLCPLSSSGCPMIIYTHPIADNLPINLWLLGTHTPHTHAHSYIHMHMYCIHTMLMQAF